MSNNRDLVVICFDLGICLTERSRSNDAGRMNAVHHNRLFLNFRYSKTAQFFVRGSASIRTGGLVLIASKAAGCPRPSKKVTETDSSRYGSRQPGWVSESQTWRDDSKNCLQGAVSLRQGCHKQGRQ